MKKNKSNKILSWLLVLIWVVTIFSLSSMRGSAGSIFSLLYFIERKTFHVAEYFILAVLLYRAFSQSFNQKKSLWFSVGIALVYAASDEWHQTFIFSRDGTVRDVAIDLIGILLAAFFILKFIKWKKIKQ